MNADAFDKNVTIENASRATMGESGDGQVRDRGSVRLKKMLLFLRSECRDFILSYPRYPLLLWIFDNI